MKWEKRTSALTPTLSSGRGGEIRVLALCDSPATRPDLAPTGFARVAKNLFTEWTAGTLPHGISGEGEKEPARRSLAPPSKIQIDIWGLGFEGWGYDAVPWRIFPGGGADWNTPRKLTQFLNQLATGWCEPHLPSCEPHGQLQPYTHVWMIMDADALIVGEGEKSFASRFWQCCARRGIRSMLYFPVDARSFRPEWTEIVRAVDCAVTYTETGRETVLAAAEPRPGTAPPGFSRPLKIHVLPHGLEEHFAPVRNMERQAIREEITVPTGAVQNWKEVTRPFAGPEDFLMLNVNKNEWRKDPLRTLEILAGLRAAGVPAKLILRMDPFSTMGGINLKLAADQLGLADGMDWVMLGAVAEADLPKLYNAADLYLTTTLGEGWGLGITEALGCGTAVAMPRHTSCGEIGNKIMGHLTPNPSPQSGEGERAGPNIVWLEAENGFVCGGDMRLRQRVDLPGAVKRIKDFYESRKWKERPALSTEIREWLSWKRIAAEMFSLLTQPPGDEFF